MLKLAGIQINGVSVAGLETCLELPAYRLAFDIGRGPRSAVSMSTVAFTHSHVDHMGGLAHHVATRAMLGLSPPTYLVPEPLVQGFEALLDAIRMLDGSELPCRVVRARPGEDVDIGKGRFLRPFSVDHTMPALGYGLWQRKQKLRPSLQGASRDVIAAARSAGEEISVPCSEPLVAFTGDTRFAVFEREPVLQQAKLLMMEVTFLDERVSVERANSTGHIHLDEVLQRSDLLCNEAILFTHLSARYRYPEALEILKRRLPPELAERVTLLPRPDWCR